MPANKALHSDCQKLRRFALQLLAAGEFCRWAAGASCVVAEVGDEESILNAEYLQRKNCHRNGCFERNWQGVGPSTS